MMGRSVRSPAYYRRADAELFSSMSQERPYDTDLLEVTCLMGEVSLGGRDSLQSQRDIPHSSGLVQSVPDEVLAEIFQAGRDSDDSVNIDYSSLPFPHPFPHLVSSVSRRWRDVALNSPRLWTTIVINCDQMTYRREGSPCKDSSLCIERSKACLLDITILTRSSFRDYHLENNLQTAMDQIMPHTSRWRRFTVNNLRSQNMIDAVIPRLRTASAPHLRYFQITFDFPTPTYASSNACVRLFTEGAASLTDARLIGTYIYTPPLTGLTYLQFGGTPLEDMEITVNFLRDLVTAPLFLIKLDLQRLDIVFPLDTTSSVSDIQIPSLCSLVMSRVSSRGHDFWKLFSLFSLPKLDTLTLAHMSQFSEPLTDIGHQIYATVTVLGLLHCNHIHHSLAKSLYSSFPSINQLDVVGSSGLVLEPPYVRYDGDLAVIWPRLETITITYPVTYGMIRDFIDNRKEMGHPLGVVNVWSRIRRKREVCKLDYGFKSRFQYAPGLASAIEEVEYEEYDDRRYEEEHLSSRDFEGYEGDSG